jgi:plastocyanin
MIDYVSLPAREWARLSGRARHGEHPGNLMSGSIGNARIAVWSVTGGRPVHAVVCVMLSVLVAACSGGASDRPRRRDAPEPAAAPPPAAPATSTVVGKAPAAGGGIPAVIILKPHDASQAAAQTFLPAMDQVSMTFIPGILFVRINQPAQFRNSDDVLHNVRVLEVNTKEPAFNVAIPTGGAYDYTFTKEGFYDVGCDIHQAMSAVVVATSTPFATLAAPDGAFTIEGVPAGAYTLTVYADVRKLEREVTIVPGRTEVGSVG